MFKIVSSSAGSGKTYTLTKEYLKLVLQNDDVHYFKHILAITFTKAATREMKERILGRLEVFGKGEEDPMLHDILRELYPESLHDREGAYRVHEQKIRQRAQQIFLQILHDYSDFAILTIDSFVQRVVSAFTDELGMPFSFEVEMEAGELLLMAVERLLEKAGDEDSTALTDILESFYLEAGQEGANYHSLPEALAGFAKDLLNEQRYAAIVKNKDLTAKDFKQIRRQMVAATKKWEAQAVSWAETGLQLILDNGLDEKAFSFGTVFRYFKKRIAADEALVDPGVREVDAFENDKGWYTKTARGFVVETIENIKGELTDYYDFIEKIRTKHGSLYHLYKLLTPHLYHLSLLNEIKEEFDRQLRDNNRVHISEFNQKILQIVTEDPVPFIYERMGEKFNHILIDEFQDTSKLQFANLLPLIDNSLGYEHFNLAVGDSKQAIYRFRGGDMDQIIALHSQNLDRLYQSLGTSDLTTERLENIRWHLQGDELKTNRRSAKEIIEFNNNFFQTIEGLYSTQFPLSREVFAQVVQELPPNPKTGGEVNIEFIENSKSTDEDENDTSTMLKRTLEIIRQTTEQDGFAVGDISVLCRGKKEAKGIANLLKENGYSIISEDSLSLRFSGAVNLVTAFMRVLVKPDSRLDKYEALYLFFRMILQKIPVGQDNQHIKTAVESQDVKAFYQYVNGLLVPRSEKRETRSEKRVPSSENPVASSENPVASRYDDPSAVRDENSDNLLVTRNSTLGIQLNPYKLLQISAYELAEKLMQTFGLFEIESERDYLFRFLDVLMEFSTKRGSHLSDFLDYWETQKDKISISAPSDPQAITVQTIHRSKGLEYPVVIVPYANWEFVPSAKRDSMWVTLDPTDDLRVGSFDFRGLEAGEMIEHSEVKFLQTGSVQVKNTLEKTPENVSQQYRDECEKVFVENLNLLYVAFTRPTKRLYILAKAEKDFTKIKNPSRINYWLWQFLEGRQPSATSHQLSTDDQSPTVQAAPLDVQPYGQPRPTSNVQRPFFIPHIISTDRSRALRLRRLANRVFDVETFERKKDHGNKVHYALSLVRTRDDVPSAILRMKTEGLIEPTEATEIQKSLEKVLQHPDLEGLFDVTSNVLNEREILTPDGNMHRPDRVVYLPDCVVILDYKTGIPLEAHSNQIKRYVGLFKQMGFERVEALLVYIEKNEVVKVQ